MAGKAKSVYLTVCPKGKLNSVFKKVFFDAKSLNEYIKTEDLMTKYPAEEFTFIKETF